MAAITARGARLVILLVGVAGEAARWRRRFVSRMHSVAVVTAFAVLAHLVQTSELGFVVTGRAVGHAG